MNTNNLVNDDFSGDYTASFFGSLGEDNYDYRADQENEICLKLNNVNNMECNEEIPSKLYLNFNAYHYNDDNALYDEAKQDSEYDIASVMGENDYQVKKEERTHSHDTNSTLKDDSSNSSKKSYEALFLMIDDKSMYEIGNSDDELSTQNNPDLLKLDKIISDEYTNMNDFIGDMLKSCPCDNLIKKQRIYKAKNIKRKRKSKSQIKVLEKEFKKNQNWDKEDIKTLSKMLDLNRDQVYKWFWDQKKKSDQ